MSSVVLLSEEMKALSGHVEGLVMPGNSSKAVHMATPGTVKDNIRELRKTKVADAGQVKAVGDLTDSLVESTAAYLEGPGRGLAELEVEGGVLACALSSSFGRF